MNRYIQTQKYAECKLIAVLNARTYLTGEYIDPASKEYEALVDLVKARHGSAFISEIKNLLEQFNMGYKPGPATFDWIKRHLPVEVCIHHPKLGYHCICIIDVEYHSGNFKFSEYIYVTNFFNRSGVFWDEFSKLIVRNMPNFGIGHDAISYYLKGKKNG